MTTIAFDGRLLAADSLLFAEDLKFGTCDKITQLSKDTWMATAGDAALEPIVAEWLRPLVPKSNWLAKAIASTPEILKDEEILGLIVTCRRGVVSAWELSNMRIYPVRGLWGGGSGEVVAMTAMHLGKSAIGALRVACALDRNTGYPVMAVDVTTGEVHTVQAKE